nr:hypothetical protein [Spirochaeta sp.]
MTRWLAATARPAHSRLRRGVCVLSRAALFLTVLVLLGCQNPTGDDNGPVVIPSYVHGDGVP